MKVKAATLKVGPNEIYNRIQDAIDDANAGDVIFVRNGIYYEHLNISKQLSLTGESKESTIINGSEEIGNTMHISANGTTISGFTILGGGATWGDAGLKLEGVRDCQITDNIVTVSNYCGIKLLFSNNNTIDNNTISKNNESGIFLEESSGNTISNNMVYPDNLVGISVGFSNLNKISNNEITENKLMGIDTWDSNENIYKKNRISSNQGNAIEFWNANNNLFIENEVSFNQKDGIHSQSSMNNTFKNNSLIENGFSFGGYFVKHWNTHTIAESNTVNGRPVLYWRDRNSGTVPTGAGQIILANCTNVQVKNQDISKTSEGIVLGFSSQNRIENNDVTSNSRYGIAAWRSNGNYIANNNIASNKNFGISILYSDNNNITGNTISKNKDGIELRAAKNHKLFDNELTDNGVFISGNLIESWRLEFSNEIVDDEGTVLWAYSSQYWNTHTIAQSNTINNKPIIYWKNRNDGTIPFGASQVILANCTNVIVKFQNLTGGSFGVELGFSSKNIIYNNTVSSNIWHGIYLESSDNNNITDTFIFANKLNGIYLDFSNRNTISNNKISSNHKNGIYLFFSKYNIISKNNIISNEDNGLHLDLESNNNNIFYNDFIDNQNQATDHGINQWGVDYPKGGNYWSDFSGVDNYIGPEQNISGKDGLSDISYEGIVSWESIRDEYPLMLRWKKALQKPSAPQNLQINAGDDYLSLSWSLPASEGGAAITGYNIYRGTQPGTETFLTGIGTGFSYNDTNLTNGKTYYYTLSALSIRGEGVNSSEVHAAPGSETDSDADEPGIFLFLGILIIIIWIIIIILIFIMMRKKPKKVNNKKPENKKKFRKDSD